MHIHKNTAPLEKADEITNHFIRFNEDCDMYVIIAASFLNM